MGHHPDKPNHPFDSFALPHNSGRPFPDGKLQVLLLPLVPCRAFTHERLDALLELLDSERLGQKIRCTLAQGVGRHTHVLHPGHDHHLGHRRASLHLFEDGESILVG